MANKIKATERVGPCLCQIRLRMHDLIGQIVSYNENGDDLQSALSDQEG
jgi:hypothetical protein